MLSERGGEMKFKKFTFRTEKSKGRYYSFYNATTHYIKLDKKVVGWINDEPPYKIRLSVIKQDILEDGHPNCPWKWITLKAQFSSLQEAKTFLNDNRETIQSKYPLHFEEDIKE